jgi:hypothetical protein
MTYNEIIKGLFVGDIKDPEYFRSSYPDGVIINILEGGAIDPERRDYLWVPLLYPLTTYPKVNKTNKELIMKLIHENLIQGKNILVHCGAGMERSPLVVACYLKEYHMLSLDEAYKVVKTHRRQTIDRRDWL